MSAPGGVVEDEGVPALQGLLEVGRSQVLHGARVPVLQSQQF